MAENGIYPNMKPVMPKNTVGWGWSQWGEWVEDACPEVCGRRLSII